MVKLFMVLLLAAPAAHGAGGRLQDFSGEVSVFRAKKKLDSKKGMRLKNGDKLVTGRKAWAIVDAGKGSLLKLNENTSVDLELSVRSRKGETAAQRVILDVGALFTKVRKGIKFKVRTPSMVASVRGTQFFTAYGREVKEGRDLWLCVNEGVVEVESLSGGGKVSVKEGEGIIIEPGKKIIPPKEYAWTKDLNWNMDPKKGSVEDTTSLEGAYGDLLDIDYE